MVKKSVETDWHRAKQKNHCFAFRADYLEELQIYLNRFVLYFWAKEVGKKEHGWRKLYDKLPLHEQSLFHKHCYADWRELKRWIKQDSEIHCRLDATMAKNVKYCRGLLKSILKVVLFIAERGLAFRWNSDKIRHPHNGYFLEILELVGNFYAPLQEHLTKVQNSQESGTRLQAHYLSYTSQNEFIEVCSNRVIEKTEERKASWYFSP